MALGFFVGIYNILVHNMHTYNIRASRKHPKNDIFLSFTWTHVPRVLYFSVFPTVVRERRLYNIFAITYYMRTRGYAPCMRNSVWAV